MQRLQNISKRILAAMIFFTRLPLWRLCDIEREYYERVTPLWPMTGWVIGGFMALTYWGASALWPVEVAVVMALVARIMLTGALHEDGFADFCDGFGGGTTRVRILEIMKDSHIGTYGVLGLVIYFLLMYTTLCHLLPLTNNNPLTFIAVDTLAKMLASTIVYFLPYARKESEAKNKLIYSHVPLHERVITFGLGILPISLLSAFMTVCLLQAMLIAIMVVALLFLFMHRRIGGYTGDCCGATFIIAEMTIYLTLLGLLGS